MTEPQPHPDREIESEYPAGIVARPFTLDDLVFEPEGKFGNMERATRDGSYVGDVLFDKGTDWKARKHDARGELTDWQPMRCAAEARAFLVSTKPI